MISSSFIEGVRVDQRAGFRGLTEKFCCLLEHLDQLAAKFLSVRTWKDVSCRRSFWAAIPLFPAFCFFLYAQPFQPLVRQNRD